MHGAASTGGNKMSIDFQANPYGMCSFYIGDTWGWGIYHSSDVEYFSKNTGIPNTDCKKLTDQIMGNDQNYKVRYS